MASNKKISLPISDLSSEETYALLDSIESDCEEDIDNLMTDSDTEFVFSLLHEGRVSHKTLTIQSQPIQ